MWLQDPDTFRDLLYAVVTEQRNNEDSKRKGMATQAGMRRAALVVTSSVICPDGYLLHTWAKSGCLRKRMVLDPERQPLIEFVFRLALRGRTCGQIAKSVNDAGWLTKQGAKAWPATTVRCRTGLPDLEEPALHRIVGPWRGGDGQGVLAGVHLRVECNRRTCAVSPCAVSTS
jgi:hypothetical protein